MQMTERIDEMRRRVAEAGLQPGLRVTREADPAGPADVDFIALAMDVVPRWLDAVASGTTGSITESQLAAAEEAARRASPGPWIPFLESRQPIGGCSVIWVGGEDSDEPDMYLWRGDEIADDGDFDFVAHAREDLPWLAAEIRRLREAADPGDRG